MNKNIFQTIVFVFALVLIGSSVALAQGPPPPGGGTPNCFPDPCMPIDGGISFLLAAGAAYGAKKMYNSRNK